MITRTSYICECCNTEFEVEADALNCEASHIQPDAIETNLWAFGKKYPDKMNIEMGDGAVCEYVYRRELQGPTPEEEEEEQEQEQGDTPNE